MSNNRMRQRLLDDSDRDSTKNQSLCDPQANKTTFCASASSLLLVSYRFLDYMVYKNVGNDNGFYAGQLDAAQSNGYHPPSDNTTKSIVLGVMGAIPVVMAPSMLARACYKLGTEGLQWAALGLAATVGNYFLWQQTTMLATQAGEYDSYKSGYEYQMSAVNSSFIPSLTEPTQHHATLAQGVGYADLALNLGLAVGAATYGFFAGRAARRVEAEEQARQDRRAEYGRIAERYRGYRNPV
jgi:hypothetical protein